MIFRKKHKTNKNVYLDTFVFTLKYIAVGLKSVSNICSKSKYLIYT